MYLAGNRRGRATRFIGTQCSDRASPLTMSSVVTAFWNSASSTTLVVTLLKVFDKMEMRIVTRSVFEKMAYTSILKGLVSLDFSRSMHVGQ